MRNVYLSFLGLGAYNKETGAYHYLPAVYELGGKKSRETRFVQAAKIELMDGLPFDIVLIATTQKSYDAHFNTLSGELKKLRICSHYRHERFLSDQ